MWCGGSRGRAVEGSSRPRGRCGASSSVLALSKIEPARTRAQNRVRAARAAAKSAGAAAGAGSSEPQPWGSARGDGEASGAGFGPAPRAHLDERQSIDPRIETVPATREEVGVRWLEITEPAGTVLGRPGWRQVGHGFARTVGGRVLGACVAALGWQGPKGGRRAFKSADTAPKRLVRTGGPARTWDRAWRTSDIILRARNGHKGAQTGGHAPRKGEEGGQVEVHRGADVLERRHRLVSLREDGFLRSRRKILSTRDPAARHRTVSWGRGVVGGLAKANAGKLGGPLWAEAGTPAIEVADLLGERGGTKGARSRRGSR